MDLYNEVEKLFATALATGISQGYVDPRLAAILTAGAAFEPARSPEHGDLATNAAISCAKATRMAPLEAANAIAKLLTERLGQANGILKAEVAGPGFVNVVMTDQAKSRFLHGALKTREGETFGVEDLGCGTAVNVEYVSANPTGPMHVGHARGAIIGDSVAAMFSALGYDVTKEFYLNDAGGQIAVLAESTLLRYREALGEDVGEYPKGSYRGDYLKPIGAGLAAAHGRKLLDLPRERAVGIAAEFSMAETVAGIRADLLAAGVTHDVFTSERATATAVKAAAAIEKLRAADLIYLSSAGDPEDKGGDPAAGHRIQPLFRSTRYGDDKDRPVTKAGGENTYFLSDIVYHADKAQRLAEATPEGTRPVMVDVWGSDHSGYVARMRGAVSAMTDDGVDFEPLLCNLVSLKRNGIAVPMSKRDGEFVTMREVVDEVGRDSLRFMMLMRQPNSPLDFDLAKVVETSKDNPVFYVQYAHARCASAIGMAAEAGIDASVEWLSEADSALLAESGEKAVLGKLMAWPRTLRHAAMRREPHRIAFYLTELAGEFHAMWTAGSKDRAKRIVSEAPETTRARLALVAATRAVVAAGLGILGVSRPVKMERAPETERGDDADEPLRIPR